jgi:heptosyltransferase-2
MCSSLHEPRKRWFVESWKVLIERIVEKYKNTHVNLYGAKSDAAFLNEVALFFSRTIVSNLAGATDLLELASYLQKDDLIISIDTGGMHFANMFGCPLICIFGVTNPVATGPIFSANKMIITPDSCPLKGGFPTEDVEVDTVFRAVQNVLQQ